MRQVTGSNPIPSNEKVSIQLKLDGHSFSRDMLPKRVSEDVTAQVELLTAKSVAVPEECFEAELATSLLSMSGIVVAKDEEVVWSEAVDGIIAVMAIPHDFAEGLKSKFGDRLCFTSPLLRTYVGKGEYLYIYNVGKVAYLKLYKGEQLLYCEATSVAGDDDLLYIVERLAQEFQLTSMKILLAGESSTKLTTLLKQYYKVEKCE